MLNGISKKSAAILFVLAQLLVLVAPVPALAADPTSGAQPPVPDVVEVTAEETSALGEIALNSEQYLQVEADGTLVLNLADPAMLGVDQAFLDAYKAGLEEVNALVRAGELTIKNDLSVAWAKELPANEAAPTPKEPAGVQPDWAAYPYQSGVTLYFNYREAGRIPGHGLSYASTIGAHLRRPYTVPHYTYLFTRSYNHRVFRHHHYNYGTYVHTPWYHYRSRYHYKTIYFYRYYRGGGRWVSNYVYY